MNNAAALDVLWEDLVLESNTMTSFPGLHIKELWKA
jgi:hypothetical protein